MEPEMPPPMGSPASFAQFVGDTERMLRQRLAAEVAAATAEVATYRRQRRHGPPSHETMACVVAQDADRLATSCERLLATLDTVTTERDALRAEAAEIHRELGELLGVAVHWLERDPTTEPLATIRQLWERTASYCTTPGHRHGA